jgi:RHS repeat-associated protein
VEYSATANDTEKYATYTRDSLTGLDYAVNRYYSSIWGRFLSPDPYGASARVLNPQSWNRYAYTIGDPMNSGDPSGLGCTGGEHMPSDYCQFFGPISSTIEWSPSDMCLIQMPVGADPVSWAASCLGGSDAISGSQNPTGGGSGGARGGGGQPTTPSCSVIPSGAEFGGAASIGLLGGQSASAALFIDYDTGHVSVAVSVGLQAGWSGGASVSAGAGYIFGPNNATSNIMNGGDTGAQVSVGPIQAGVASTSGGIQNPDPRLVQIARGFAVMVGAQASLASTLLGGGLFVTSTLQVFDLGSFGKPGILNTLFASSPIGQLNLALYALRQSLCH